MTDAVLQGLERRGAAYAAGAARAVLAWDAALVADRFQRLAEEDAASGVLLRPVFAARVTAAIAAMLQERAPGVLFVVRVPRLLRAPLEEEDTVARALGGVLRPLMEGPALAAACPPSGSRCGCRGCRPWRRPATAAGWLKASAPRWGAAPCPWASRAWEPTARRSTCCWPWPVEPAGGTANGGGGHRTTGGDTARVGTHGRRGSG